MNNKEMNYLVVCAGKSARLIEGAKQMANTQKSGAGARMNAPRSFIKTKLAKVYHSPRAGAKIFARRIGGELGGFLKPQHLNASSQTGRTILEMLAVLAIVGVLSIGGLLGYRLVIIRYKANETIHDVMLRATNVPMVWNDYASLYDYKYIFPELIPNDVNPVGYAVETWAEPIDSDFFYRVEVKDMPYEVCRHIISMKPTDIALYKAGDEIDRTGVDSSQNDCGRDTINMYFFFTGEFSDEERLCTRANYTESKECCEAFGSEWVKGACRAPCEECEMRNPSSGVCAYNPSLNKECCEKTSPNYWANGTCCEREEQSKECCLFAAREWSGSTCCTAGQVVVGGECQTPTTCSACQDYNAATNTCTNHVRTSECCTAAGRLWSGSTCCTAGQVVVSGECQTPTTCSACQDYNAATNTCTDHVRTSACCTAAGRLWSGSTCCSAGLILIGNNCATCCSAGKGYDKIKHTCTECAAGYYSDVCDNLACKKCPHNTYSAADAKSCIKCPDGTVSEAGSSSCTPCPAGTYRNSSSASVGTNAWECAPCPAGTYSTGGAKSCTKCPEGTVSQKGASACSACPAGTVYSAGKCISCPAGKYAYNGLCVSCQNGYYSAANATSCTSCGTYATSNANKSGCTCMYTGTWPNCKSRSGS